MSFETVKPELLLPASFVKTFVSSVPGFSTYKYTLSKCFRLCCLVGKETLE